MIRHIVMWDLSGDGPDEKRRNAEIIRSCFLRLRGRIPGLITLDIGIDISRADYACDVVLYSEFESAEALDRYAGHPEHLKVKLEIGDIRIARHQVDYHFKEEPQ